MPYSGLSPAAFVALFAHDRSAAFWDEFVRRYQPVIARIVARQARSVGEYRPEIIEELVQSVFERICEKEFAALRTFTPEHGDSFYGYLKVLSVHVVTDCFKAARAGKRGGGAAPLSLDDADRQPGALLQDKAVGVEREILVSEIERELESLEEGEAGKRDREIFRLYYRVGMSASDIGKHPAIRMNPKSVQSVLRRLTLRLRKALRPPESSTDEKDNYED